MKDFYDVYMFLIKKRDLIDENTVKDALKSTLAKRYSLEYYRDYKQILDGLINFEKINKYWVNYTKKNKYAQGIDFNEIIRSLEEFIFKINLKL